MRKDRGILRAVLQALPCLALAHAAIAASSSGALEKKLEDAIVAVEAEAAKKPVWQNDLDTALVLARNEYLPVLVLFSSPDCPWCDRIKADIEDDKETGKLLAHFVLVDIDVSRKPETGMFYGVRGVPTVLIMTSNGNVTDGVSGYVPGDQLRAMLTRALNPKLVREIDSEYIELVHLLDENRLPTNRWAEVMIMLGDKAKRQGLHDRVLGYEPFPKQELVRLLWDARLAVRLGTLELLEEKSGTSYDYDPWLAQSREKNEEALGKWEAWAKEKDETEAKQRYSSLTQEQLRSYVLDVVSDKGMRAVRARQMLEQAGPDAARAVSDFLDSNPNLSEGARRRVKEVQYALYIPAVVGIDPSVMAHRLLFGTQAMRLKSLSKLQAAGKRGIPVFRDFLDHPDSLVREAAVESLIVAGGNSIVALLEDRLKEEKDFDVMFTILRGLGKTKSKRTLLVLTSFLKHDKEDLAAVSLESIAMLRSKTAEKEIAECLDDSRWRVRVAALAAVAKLEIKTLSDKVQALLKDKDEFVRFSAVAALATLSAVNAATALEECFMKEDALKAPVIAALGSMNRKLPESFGAELEKSQPEVILASLEALEDSDSDDVSIAARFMNHESEDISCAAIRLVARRAMDKNQYRGQLLQVLADNNQNKILAALESLHIDKQLLMPYQSMFSDWFADDASEPSNRVVSAEVESLFDAFADQGSGSVEKPEAPGPPAKQADAEPVPDGIGMVGDLLSSFDDADDAASAVGSGPSDIPSLLKALEGLLGESHGEPIRFQSALLLARLGNPRGLPLLGEAMDSRTSAQRISIAENLSALKSLKSLPIYKKLLDDPVDSVRTEAAEACIGQTWNAAFLDAVFETLLKKDGRLKPHEVYGYKLESAASSGSPAVKTAIRKRITHILKTSDDTALQNFALIVLEKIWRRDDEKILEPFTKSGDPWQRRAALHTLGKCNLAGFREKLRLIADDPSEYVRAVIPNVYMAASASWTHHFDEKHFEADHYYWRSSSQRRSGSLTDMEKETLMRLTEDTALSVRVEAFICLLSNRVEIDLARFVETLDSVADRKSVASRVASYLSDNYKRLGPGFRVLVPYLEESVEDDSTLKRIRGHFNIEETDKLDEISFVVREEKREPIKATFLETAEVPGGERPAVFKLVYFTSPGCQDCARVERMLPDLESCFPALSIDTHNIRKVDAMRLNEALCERFGVPEGSRLVTPAVFSGSGYLIKKDVTFAGIGDLLARSAVVPLEGWYEISDKELEKAEEIISERYSGMSVWMVMLAGGLIDGINPCAFATIIFFLSYLHVARRSAREIVRVGAAFIMGVFLAYYVLGLGLVEIVARLTVLRGFSRGLNWAIAAFALLIMILSIRDGVLCLRGRLQDIALQLPEALKTGIRWVIRRGMRHRHFVIAAFIAGIVISCLELACTGQVYAPTILFMLKTRKDVGGALFNLALYNVAFVIPLIIIFVLAFFGMTSNALIRFMQKHAATVKFLTAALFFALFLLFVFGEKLGAVSQM